jgi:hypothetical protein
MCQLCVHQASTEVRLGCQTPSRMCVRTCHGDAPQPAMTLWLRHASESRAATHCNMFLISLIFILRHHRPPAGPSLAPEALLPLPHRSTSTPHTVAHAWTMQQQRWHFLLASAAHTSTSRSGSTAHRRRQGSPPPGSTHGTA